MKTDRNKQQKEFSFYGRYKSFLFAFKGLSLFFRTQRNSWIHCIVTIIAISLGFLLKVSTLEWCFLIFAIGLVFTAELFNTAIEFLTDIVSPDYNEKAGRVKDIAAAGVLLAAITSAAIGVIVFIPKVIIFIIE